MHDERRDLSGSERSVDIAHRPDGDVDALGPVDEPVSWCGDRKSTRLNSSHSQISYAVFCLKKKNSTWHPPSPIPFACLPPPSCPPLTPPLLSLPHPQSHPASSASCSVGQRLQPKCPLLRTS